MNTRRFLLAAVLALATLPASGADKVHRLALQISDDTPDANARVVPSGVVSLIELGEKGWTIVRP